jgi:hypothetical protein
MPWYDVIVHDNTIERYRIEAASEDGARAIINSMKGPCDPDSGMDPDAMKLIKWERYVAKVTEIRNPNND